MNISTFRWGALKQIGRAAAVVVVLASGNALAAEIYGDATGLYVVGAPADADSMRIRGPKGYSVSVDSLQYEAEEPLPEGTYQLEVYRVKPGAQLPPVPDAATNISNGRKPDAVPGLPKEVIAGGGFIIDSSGELVTIN